MKVEKYGYSLENKLIAKLNLMVRRTTGKNRDDNLLLIDGDEGQGKTTLGVCVCGYISDQTGRPFNVNHVFFDLDKLIQFAVNTKEQIILWDEGALGGLAVEWWNKNQKKFLKLLMVARKKRHFFIICIPKFFKLNEYFVVDRSIGLLHVYSRRNIQKGRFCYFTKKKKEALYNHWKKKHLRSYKKFFKFTGSFPNALSKVIDEAAYDKKKDEAIMGIAVDDKMPKEKEQLIKLKYLIYTFPVGTVVDRSKHFGVSEQTMHNWAKLNDKYPEIVGIEG